MFCSIKLINMKIVGNSGMSRDIEAIYVDLLMVARLDLK